MGRKSYKALAGCIVCLFFIAACKKDKPDPAVVPPINVAGANVYVVCEGSLGNGNAELTLYKPSVDSSYEDVYKAANGQSLGDVFQSMTRVGNKLFLCINNSDKIVVIDRSNWTLSGTISVTKPRYILPVSDTKAYVSSLFSNKVYIVNLQSLEVTGQITLPGNNPEQMLLYNNKAFIPTWDSTVNKLFVVDCNTDQLSQTIQLPGYAPKEMVLDKNNKIWLLSGNLQANKPAYFTQIDPVTYQVLNTYPFRSTADPLRPTFNATKDTIYYIEINYAGGTDNNGVYRMPVTAGSVPSVPFKQAQQYQYYYAVGVDPNNGNIYISDPKGFTQKGTVYIYRPDGSAVSQFNTGVGPGHFYFD